MSYCRWSTDDFRCDLYVYEHVGGYWAIHVAGSRHNPTTPKPVGQCRDLATGKFLPKGAGGALTRRSVDKLFEWLDRDREDIVLPHAGETFNLATPGECADKIEELITLGYRCPAYVVEQLRREANGQCGRCGGNVNPQGYCETAGCPFARREQDDPEGMEEEAE